MIKVRLVSTKKQELVSFESTGHAGKDVLGKDIVCSAVTVLLKTAMLSLVAAERTNPDFKLSIKSDTRGFLSLKVDSFSENERTRLRYLYEFLTLGLMSVMEEYPDFLDFSTNEVT